jgi:NADH dehydrogenase
MPLPRVVIIGAGFGGLACARKLARKPVEVLILDRNNYHLFTPLLYQVASSLLNPNDIAQPVRKIFRGETNVRVRLAEVTGVDSQTKLVRTSTGEEISYDYLVIAAGSTTNFFGLESAERTALGLKDLPEAMELRNHILKCLENAAVEPMKPNGADCLPS